MNISPIITEDVLIDVFPKYLDFFDRNTFKTCNRNFDKNIDYIDFNNKYLEINSALFEVLKTNDIDKLNVLEKIYPIGKIIENENKYLLLISDIEMFKYIENKYLIELDNLEDIYETCIDHFINTSYNELTKYLFIKLNSLREYFFDYSNLISSILYSESCDFVMYVLDNFVVNNLENEINHIIPTIVTMMAFPNSLLQKNQIIEILISITDRYNIDQLNMNNQLSYTFIDSIIRINNIKLFNYFKMHYKNSYESNKLLCLDIAFNRGNFELYIMIFNEINNNNNIKKHIISEENELFKLYYYDKTFKIREWLHKNDYLQEYEEKFDKDYFDKLVSSRNINYLKFYLENCEYFIDKSTIINAIKNCNLYFIKIVINRYPEYKNMFNKIFYKYCANNGILPMNIIREKQDLYLDMIKYQPFFNEIKGNLHQILIWAINNSLSNIIKWIIETNNIITNKEYFKIAIIYKNHNIFEYLYNEIGFDDMWVEDIYLICSKYNSFKILRFMHENYNIHETFLKSSFESLLMNQIKYPSFLGFRQDFIKWMSETKYILFFNDNNIKINVGEIKNKAKDDGIMHNIVLKN